MEQLTLKPVENIKYFSDVKMFEEFEYEGNTYIKIPPCYPAYSYSSRNAVCKDGEHYVHFNDNDNLNKGGAIKKKVSQLKKGQYCKYKQDIVVLSENKGRSTMRQCVSIKTGNLMSIFEDTVVTLYELEKKR